VSRTYRIAVDVMGGDGAPTVPLEGALSAVREIEGLEVLLVGKPAVVRKLLADRNGDDRLKVLPATQTIGPRERPARAVRRKTDSSIVVGLEALRSGEADAFISAGSTGAVMAASMWVLGVLPGIARPPVGALVPTSEGPIMVVDAGANVNARAYHLHQFAHLGNTYCRDLLGVPRPRIGLLNVGEEKEKGDSIAQAAHRLLQEDEALNFIGNVEGHRIIEGICDVLVCNGFVGNALLKFYESMAGFLLGLLGERLMEQGELADVARVLDYAEYGGAPLLGVNGVSIICHGASPPRAIRNAIRTAVGAVESGMVQDMARDLAQLDIPWWRRRWRPVRRT
jgi:glycerol-3-phosphate acyltransferase PlsX